MQQQINLQVKILKIKESVNSNISAVSIRKKDDTSFVLQAIPGTRVSSLYYVIERLESINLTQWIIRWNVGSPGGSIG